MGPGMTTMPRTLPRITVLNHTNRGPIVWLRTVMRSAGVEA
jgi:hypothetical protein